MAGIRSVRLYGLRQTAATLGIAAGVSVKVISDQLDMPRSSAIRMYCSIQDDAAAKVDGCSVGEVEKQRY
jgi:hypothetical protein